MPENPQFQMTQQDYDGVMKLATPDFVKLPADQQRQHIQSLSFMSGMQPEIRDAFTDEVLKQVPGWVRAQANYAPPVPTFQADLKPVSKVGAILNTPILEGARGFLKRHGGMGLSGVGGGGGTEPPKVTTQEEAQREREERLRQKEAQGLPRWVAQITTVRPSSATIAKDEQERQSKQRSIDFKFGFDEGLTDAGVDMTSLKNLGLMATVGLAGKVTKFPRVMRLLKGGAAGLFSADMAAALKDEVPEAYEAYQRGDYRGAGHAAGQALVTGYFLSKTAPAAVRAGAGPTTAAGKWVTKTARNAAGKLGEFSRSEATGPRPPGPAAPSEGGAQPSPEPKGSAPAVRIEDINPEGQRFARERGVNPQEAVDAFNAPMEQLQSRIAGMRTALGERQRLGAENTKISDSLAQAQRSLEQRQLALRDIELGTEPPGPRLKKARTDVEVWEKHVETLKGRAKENSAAIQALDKQNPNLPGMLDVLGNVYDQRLAQMTPEPPREQGAARYPAPPAATPPQGLPEPPKPGAPPKVRREDLGAIRTELNQARAARDAARVKARQAEEAGNPEQVYNTRQELSRLELQVNQLVARHNAVLNQQPPAPPMAEPMAGPAQPAPAPGQAQPRMAGEQPAASPVAGEPSPGAGTGEPSAPQALPSAPPSAQGPVAGAPGTAAQSWGPPPATVTLYAEPPAPPRSLLDQIVTENRVSSEPPRPPQSLLGQVVAEGRVGDERKVPPTATAEPTAHPATSAPQAAPAATPIESAAPFQPATPAMPGETPGAQGLPSARIWQETEGEAQRQAPVVQAVKALDQNRSEQAQLKMELESLLGGPKPRGAVDEAAVAGRQARVAEIQSRLKILQAEEPALAETHAQADREAALVSRVRWLTDNYGPEDPRTQAVNRELVNLLASRRQSAQAPKPKEPPDDSEPPSGGLPSAPPQPPVPPSMGGGGAPPPRPFRSAPMPPPVPLRPPAPKIVVAPEPPKAEAPEAKSVEPGGGVPPSGSAQAPAQPAPQKSPSAPAGAAAPVRQEIEPKGKATEVYTIAGRKVNVRYDIREVDDTVNSFDSDYPQEYQPRQTDRAASQQRISQRKSDMNFALMSESRLASDGAPIGLKNGVNITRNHGSQALKELYDEGKPLAEQYKRDMVEHAEEYGYDPAEVAAMKRPELRRVITDEMAPEELARFAEEANMSSAARMSDAELATVLSKRMTGPLMDAFSPDEGGKPNPEFVRELIKGLPVEEQGVFMQGNGQISQTGSRIIRNIVFAKAYPDPRAIERMAEVENASLKNITAGMLAAAPQVAKFQEAVAQGDRYDLGIGPEIADAAAVLDDIHRKGMSVEDYKNQMSFEDHDPVVDRLIDIFTELRKSGKKIGEFLREYTEVADAAGSPKQESMFGPPEVPTKADVLEAAYVSAKEKWTPQKDLFGDQEASESGSGKVAAPKAPRAPEPAAKSKPKEPGEAPGAPGGKVGAQPPAPPAAAQPPAPPKPEPAPKPKPAPVPKPESKPAIFDQDPNDFMKGLIEAFQNSKKKVSEQRGKGDEPKAPALSFALPESMAADERQQFLGFAQQYIRSEIQRALDTGNYNPYEPKVNRWLKMYPDLEAKYAPTRNEPPAPGGRHPQGRPRPDVSGPGEYGGNRGLPQNKRLITVGNPPVEDLSNIPRPRTATLAPHQEQTLAAAIRASETTGGFLEASGTGAGKTVSASGFARYWVDRGKAVYIVAPQNVLKFKNATDNWPTGSYATWLKEYGLEPIRYIPGKITEFLPGRVYISTYHHDTLAHAPVDKDTVLIADESHKLKGIGTSARSEHGIDLINRAHAVLYMSATPADKPYHIGYLTRMGILEGQSEAEAVAKLGMRRVPFETKKGETKYRWEIGKNFTASQVRENFMKLFTRMIEAGNMRKAELPIAENMDVEALNMRLPEQAYPVLDQLKLEMEEHAERGAKNLANPAVRIMALRRHQEPFKIEAAVNLAKKELAEGRKVIIFASRVNESTVVARYKRRSASGEVEVEEIPLYSSPGTLRSLRDALVKAGVARDKIVELHGGSEDDPLDAMNRFQKEVDGADVVLATAASGGEGINLDDTIGNQPRTIIVMTPEFDAMSNVQLAGRINRMTTASHGRAFYLFADTPIDLWNSGIFSKKMKLLNSVVQGEVSKLDVGEWFGANNQDELQEYLDKALAPKRGDRAGGGRQASSITVRHYSDRRGERYLVFGSGAKRAADALGISMRIARSGKRYVQMTAAEYERNRKALEDQGISINLLEGDEAAQPQGRVSYQLAEREQPPEPPVALAQPPRPPETHEYSSTQVNLPAPLARKVRAAAGKIADADLSEHGRETEPHVTVLYGLHTLNANKVREVLAGEGPVRLRLGKTSTFDATDNGDVVKVDVESEDLRRLNKKIAGALEHTNSHPTYKPHVTLAYVKTGRGKKYAGMTDLEGQEVTLDRITFSGADGNKVEIPLGGKSSSRLVEKSQPAMQFGEGGAVPPDARKPLAPQALRRAVPVDGMSQDDWLAQADFRYYSGKGESRPARLWVNRAGMSALKAVVEVITGSAPEHLTAIMMDPEDVKVALRVLRRSPSIAKMKPVAQRVIARLADMIEYAAKENGGAVPIARADMEGARGAMLHEIQHLRQLMFKTLLNYKKAPVLKSANYLKAKNHVMEFGYEDDNETIIKEVFADGLAGNYDRLGITKAESEQLMWDMISAAVEKNGDKAYDLVKNAKPSVRQEIETRRAAADRARAASAGPERPGGQDAGSAQAGRSGGVSSRLRRALPFFQRSEPPRPPVTAVDTISDIAARIAPHGWASKREITDALRKAGMLDPEGKNVAALRAAIAQRKADYERELAEKKARRIAPFRAQAEAESPRDDFETEAEWRAAIDDRARRLADEEEEDSARERYDRATEEQRVEQGIAELADYVDVVANRIRSKTGIRPHLSGLSEAAYFEVGTRKLRIAAHASRPTYDLLNGAADLDLRVGSDLGEATHHLSDRATLAETLAVADEFARRLKEWEEQDESVDRSEPPRPPVGL